MENDSELIQAVVDPDRRFLDIWWNLSPSMNQSSLLLDSELLEKCENGVWLNGSMMMLSDGLDVGEYIIGDAGCTLRPWLLIPYQMENGVSLSYSKVEFNRRHSAATAVAVRALGRLKDTWKCLQGEGWHLNNQPEMHSTIGTCCALHNIVIDMEGDQEEGEDEDQEESYTAQVRQLADEDAVRMRDALSQHLIEYGVHTMAVEQAAVVASSSEDKSKEQEVHRRLAADRGKERVHES